MSFSAPNLLSLASLTLSLVPFLSLSPLRVPICRWGQNYLQTSDINSPWEKWKLWRVCSMASHPCQAPSLGTAPKSTGIPPSQSWLATLRLPPPPHNILHALKRKPSTWFSGWSSKSHSKGTMLIRYRNIAGENLGRKKTKVNFACIASIPYFKTLKTWFEFFFEREMPYGIQRNSFLDWLMHTHFFFPVTLCLIYFQYNVFFRVFLV